MNNNKDNVNENRKEVNFLKNRYAYSFVIICLLANLLSVEGFAQPGKTEITKWQDGKKTAVSITYDDGSRNQFKVALPIMERLHFPATFFIITGAIEGSAHQPKFIGRPVEQILLKPPQSQLLKIISSNALPLPYIWVMQARFPI